MIRWEGESSEMARSTRGGDASAARVLAGRYRLADVIGSGSYGVVYAADRLDGGPAVAVKTLRREMMRHAEVVRRFEQEVVLAARIRHPNLVEVLDAGTDPLDGSLFFVQPLLLGMDLKAALLREGKFAPRVAVDLMVPVMAALLALHREGIVPRLPPLYAPPDAIPRSTFKITSASCRSVYSRDHSNHSVGSASSTASSTRARTKVHTSPTV
jgi:serine/threonine protein kinase